MFKRFKKFPTKPTYPFFITFHVISGNCVIDMNNSDTYDNNPTFFHTLVHII